MALFLRTLLTSVALLNLVPSAWAQEPPKPGKQHDHLKRLVGTWDAETESGKGTMTYKMGLGGLWLIGDFEGEFGGMKFQGKGLDTYDSATKKYRSVWVDSFSTAPRIMEGNLDKDDKVMTMTGEGRGPDDKPDQVQVDHRDQRCRYGELQPVHGGKGRQGTADGKYHVQAEEVRPRDGVPLSPVFKGDWWSWRTLCSRNPIPRSHHEREERTLWTPFRPG